MASVTDATVCTVHMKTRQGSMDWLDVLLYLTGCKRDDELSTEVLYGNLTCVYCTVSTVCGMYTIDSKLVEFGVRSEEQRPSGR
jgi:hypothetical protein